MRRSVLLGFVWVFLAGCAGISEPRVDRWAGPLDPAKALEIVREAFGNRAHPNPHLDRPVRDHEVISLNSDSIQFRKIDDPVDRRQVLFFRDVASIATQTTNGIPSRPETLIIHLQPGSESTRMLDLRTDAFAWVGLRGPLLTLPERDRRLVPYFKRAMVSLRDHALRTNTGGDQLQEFVRYLEAQERRIEQEEEEDRKHRERMDRLFENR